MNINFYYRIVPIVPRRIQIALGRIIASYIRKQMADIWPISLKAAHGPDSWKGWPEKKIFSFILNHDVDTVRGFKKYLKINNIEEKLDFRSSFNLVPEGYFVPNSLRQSLFESGFEVGIRGLKHDGSYSPTERIL